MEYWKARGDNIKKHVTMRQLIDYFKIPSQSSDLITQVHCPFHGNDQHASARIYATNTMYCFFCSKSWDVISFIKDHKKLDFPKACQFLEDAFGVPKLDISVAYERKSFEDIFKEDEVREKKFDKELDKISSYLIRNKQYYSLDTYIKFFSFYDSLFANYQTNSYQSDSEMQEAITSLYYEVAKNV